MPVSADAWRRSERPAAGVLYTLAAMSCIPMLVESLDARLVELAAEIGTLQRTRAALLANAVNHTTSPRAQSRGIAASASPAPAGHGGATAPLAGPGDRARDHGRAGRWPGRCAGV
jgi:hypothetical protein